MKSIFFIVYKQCLPNNTVCCDYEMPAEVEQPNIIKKEKKILERIEFAKIEEKPIPA